MIDIVITRLDHLRVKMQRLYCLSGYSIKLIAVVCMLFDHFGKTVLVSIIQHILWPLSKVGKIPQSVVILVYNINHDIIYSIGAIAFPLFCYMIVEGYQKTRNKKLFLVRILLFAFISEIPFDLAFSSSYSLMENTFPFYWCYQNVFFTYFLGLSLLMIIDKISMTLKGVAELCLQCVAVCTICFLAEEVVYCDYGGFGVFLIVLLYILRKNRVYQILGMILLPLFVYIPRPISYVVSIMIISLYDGERGKRNMKYFFYVFYPAHIIGLYIIDTMIVPT